MRTIVLIVILTIHQSTATVDIHKLTRTASSQLQKLTEAATMEIKELVNNIDLEKVKKLDVLNILPKLTKSYNMYFGENKPEALILDPDQGQRLSLYFEKAYGPKGERLIRSLGTGLPLPVLRRMGAI